MSMLALAAVAVSAVLIVALSQGDPKRRRAAGSRGEGFGAPVRTLLAAGACVPGLACALRGDAAAFMIWLGGCGVAGWLVTNCYGARTRPRERGRRSFPRVGRP